MDIIQRLHKNIQENHSTEYKIKSFTVEDFKSLYNTLKKADKEHFENILNEEGYLSFQNEKRLFLKVLEVAFIKNNLSVYNQLKPLNLLPKQDKNKKSIISEETSEFLEFIKTNLKNDNLKFCKLIFSDDTIFNFYTYEAIKQICVYHLQKYHEELVKELIKSHFLCTKEKKDMYVDLHRILYGKLLTEREMKSYAKVFSGYKNGKDDIDDYEEDQEKETIEELDEEY